MPPATGQPIPVYEEVKWERVTENKISTVMALLPASLQSRMGPFRSIRRSMSLYNLRTKGWSDQSSPRGRPLSEADALALDGGVVSEIIEADPGRQTDVDQLQLTAPQSRELYAEPGDGDVPSRTASGIHWRFARQGKEPWLAQMMRCRSMLTESRSKPDQYRLRRKQVCGGRR